MGRNAGIRYVMQTGIKIICKGNKGNNNFMVKSLDISTTGVLLELENEEQLNIISNANNIKLEFKILSEAVKYFVYLINLLRNNLRIDTFIVLSF